MSPNVYRLPKSSLPSVQRAMHLCDDTNKLINETVCKISPADITGSGIQEQE